MAEKLSKGARGALAVAGITGLGAFAFFGANTPNRDVQTIIIKGPEPTPRIKRGSPQKVNPIQHVRGLARGDKIGEVPMLVPDHKRDAADSKYAPRKKGGTEDLVVIYSPKLDRLMLEASGLSPDYPHNTGLLLTSFPGGILESVVTFSEKTHEVEDIVPNEPLPSGTSSLYRHLPFSPKKLGFDINARIMDSPTGNAIELSINDLPPLAVGQSS